MAATADHPAQHSGGGAVVCTDGERRNSPAKRTVFKELDVEKKASRARRKVVKRDLMDWKKKIQHTECGNIVNVERGRWTMIVVVWPVSNHKLLMSDQTVYKADTLGVSDIF